MRRAEGQNFDDFVEKCINALCQAGLLPEEDKEMKDELATDKKALSTATTKKDEKER